MAKFSRSHPLTAMVKPTTALLSPLFTLLLSLLSFPYATPSPPLPLASFLQEHEVNRLLAALDESSKSNTHERSGKLPDGSEYSITTEFTLHDDVAMEGSQLTRRGSEVSHYREAIKKGSMTFNFKPPHSPAPRSESSHRSLAGATEFCDDKCVGFQDIIPAEGLEVSERREQDVVVLRLVAFGLKSLS